MAGGLAAIVVLTVMQDRLACPNQRIKSVCLRLTHLPFLSKIGLYPWRDEESFVFRDLAFPSRFPIHPSSILTLSQGHLAHRQCRAAKGHMGGFPPISPFLR